MALLGLEMTNQMYTLPENQEFPNSFFPIHNRFEDCHQSHIMFDLIASPVDHCFLQRIGRQIAINFAEQGDLVLWDVDSAGNKETAQLVRKFGVNVWTYTCDVSNRQKVYTLAQRVKDEAGTVTILVNNAGIVSGSYFLDLSDEKIMKTMGVNTMAHFWTLRAFLPDMIKNNQGHVVTVSSLVGEGGIGGMSDYSASKCAVKGLHESILRELHMYRSNVKCTVVCPYTVNTGMFNGISVKYQFLLPFITPEYVGKKVVQAVLTDTDTLYLPPYIFIAVFLMHSLPTNVQLAIENFLNANEAMKSFVGKR
ncbi:retinol dehydrogenase 10 isoform b [Apostichopus japonicus]|uniref:Short-chain dehydrogenase/reductase 3 n=1 Tax=Stichopus japonicus TaxID=307972 RepID=A0A2G8JT28_STIJA|nr:retinol dehydrogenase 10 isoform b [Apostichopus japonicus]